MLDNIDFWHWFILGVVFIILEVFAPGTFFLWMGVAAGSVGGILWFAPDISWENQFLIFALISVVSIVLWRMRLLKHPTKSEDNTLNRRTQQYVGRVFAVSEPIVNGFGKIHVDDTYWTVTGPDCEAESRVRVVSADGLTLIVELES